MSTKQVRALFLAALMVASTATFLAPTQQADAQASTADVPVPFENAGPSDVRLHLSPGTLTVNPPTGGGSTQDFPTQSATPVLPQAGETATYNLDTDPANGHQGAKYPFQIESGQGSIEVSFLYSADTACETTAGGMSGQPIDFTVWLNTTDGREVGTGSTTACGATGTVLPIFGCVSDFSRVNVEIDLDSDLEIPRNQAPQLNIRGYDPDGDGPTTWCLGSNGEDQDSYVDLDVSRVVEQATWTTDGAGTLQEAFDPDAPDGQRTLTGRMALRSPFGLQAVPDNAFTASITNPDGDRVDLLTDQEGNQTSVDMKKLDGLTRRSGALKVYKFAKPSGQAQPWAYPAGVQRGPYSVNFNGEILGDTFNFTSIANMGDFEFGPIEGESNAHELRRGTSSTFLYRIANDASSIETFEIRTTLEASQPSPWTLQVLGVDQSGRITLDPGQVELIQVRMTPPASATSGDVAEVEVEAERLATGTVKDFTAQATISQQTTRDVGVFVLSDDPQEVGIDRTTEVRAFIWNQGTAVDTVGASLDTGSFSPNNPSLFDADLTQSTFPSVTPGAAAPIPIEVTTSSQVSGGDAFTFDVQATSQSDSSATATETIQTVVEGVRSYLVSALKGTNQFATTSLQYGKFNHDTTTSQDCDDWVGIGGGSSGPTGNAAPSNDVYVDACDEYTDQVYHPIRIENTGDESETFTLGVVEGGFTHDEPLRRIDGSCSPQLDNRFENATLIQNIDEARPGSEPTIQQVTVPAGEVQRVFLRTWIDGDFTNTANRCLFERYDASVKVTPQNPANTEDPLPTRFLNTRTEVYSQNKWNTTDAAPVAWRANPVLLPFAESGGTIENVPTFSSIEPEETSDVRFTLSNQAGHFDPVNVTIGPRNLVDQLRSAGWSFQVNTVNDVPVDARTDGGLQIPAKSAEPDHASTHIAGGEFELSFAATPPAGVQEGTRHTFTLAASSDRHPARGHSIGIGIQIGDQFDFDLNPGQTSIRAHPGETVPFSLTIDNTGATRDSYAIDVANTDGLDATIDPQTVEVSSGSTKTVAVDATVPSSAQPGDTGTVEVEVVADGGTDTGPISKTASYTVTVAEQGNLTMVAQNPTVQIAPGSQQSINFTIENSDSSSKQVELTEEIVPPNWETTLTDGPLTRSVAAGGSTTFQYIINAPDNVVEPSKFPFVVRATATNNADDFANGHAYARVIGQIDVDLTAEEDRLTVDRGESITFPVRVNNPGTSPTTYDLSTQVQNAAWSTNILDADGNELGNDQVTVAEKAFERVQIEVTAPEDVSEGHIEAITLNAVAQADSSVTASTTLEAAIHDYALSVDVLESTTQDGTPGQDVEYTLAVTNEGNGADQVSVEASGPDGTALTWPVSTGQTPSIAAGETQNVTVAVQVPGPKKSPTAPAGGVDTVFTVESSGINADGSTPSADAVVTTRLLDYAAHDVDGDNSLEMGVDANRDASDGFEAYADNDRHLVERGTRNEDGTAFSSGLYTVDGDEDDRIEHIVDTNSDGLGEVYFDPDRKQTHDILWAADATGDGQPEHPIDGDFDNSSTAVYDPGQDAMHDAVIRDFTGDDQADGLIDTNDDGTYDTFIDPHATPPVVTDVEKDGNVYKIDTDGDGKADKHYNADTQTLQDAEVSNLGSFLAEYWWFPVIFLVVIVVFGVIMKQRR